MKLKIFLDASYMTSANEPGSPEASPPRDDACDAFQEEGREIRKLSASTIASGTIHDIRQTVPPGLSVRRARYGFGLFATEFFPKDSVVYIGEQIVIPNKYAEFRLILDNQNNDEFLLNTETHSVQFTETERWLYLFDSFMNHSCDPSTCSRQSESQKINNQYQTVALRDIQAGDEITCDYNLFEYDCHGKTIERCLCGTAKCVGRVAGFRYLSTDKQKDRIELVESEVLEAMTADPSNMFYFIPDLRCPSERVLIDTCRPNGDSYRIVAARDFLEGEILYRMDPLIFPDNNSIVIEFNGKRKWVDNLVHTVNMGNGKRWFSFFDSYQNHSCNPNTKQIYLNDTMFEIVAMREIAAGEELTCDYESFDDGFDGTSFKCTCGSSNCRKIIKA